MRADSHRLSILSDPLPIPRASVQYPVFSSSPVAVSDLSPPLKLQSYSLPSQVSYQELARFFRRHPDALGVLITEDNAENRPENKAINRNASTPIGMVSQQRLNQWRSQRDLWRNALQRPLAQHVAWWQAASQYVQIEDWLPLQDAIDRLLEEQVEEEPADASNLSEPIVIITATGAKLCDRNHLFAAYTRLIRAQQKALVEPAIETLRRQQQLILDAIGDGVYGVDLQGNATFINPAAAQMIGWEPQALIGKSMHQVLHHSRPDHSPYPREACPIYAAFQDGIIHRVSEEVFWRKDGSCFPVEYISTPMRDEQGKLVGAVVAFRDITQRKWAEAILQRTNEELEQRVRDRTIELQQANEQLKELSELRSRVVTMVCHEFRNPLNNILLSVSSLERYGAQLTPEQKGHYLLGIQDNVERMTQMIDAILIIGRVEAKRIEPQPSQFDLIPFCRDLMAEIAGEIQHPRLQFTCRFKRLLVTLDQCLLRSILTNILTNAIRYTPAPGKIQFKVLKQHHQIVFQITDQGIGIPPEDLPYLFEPFQRGRNVSNIAGTGLGLNIVKRFVDLHGGQINVSSQLGQGTTFQVSLPLHLPVCG
ncbi:PAS domain-containing sensor histidine kinase [Leptolyngbya sp. NK1-12]|nr:PAS domain-containing sensor histidine kinase [Leptolyngbya sp. NK1-12]